MYAENLQSPQALLIIYMYAENLQSPQALLIIYMYAENLQSPQAPLIIYMYAYLISDEDAVERKRTRTIYGYMADQV